ncbi:MAG: IS4 family transposase [Paludibacteraceae bacterium]
MASILQFIVNTCNVTMHKGSHWKEQMSYYRFWKNERVTESGLAALAAGHCVEQCAGIDHILLLEDTTELNLERHRGRIRDTAGLGVTGNDKDLGFFCHPSLAVNAAEGSLLGALDIHLWHRPQDKQNKTQRNYRRLPIEEKESYRWAERAVESGKKLAGGHRLTVVQDREGDIYESLSLLMAQGLDFVIRCRHDRKLAFPGGRLVEHIGSLSTGHEYELEVRGENRQRKKRKAQMKVRYGKVGLLRPLKTVDSDKYPPQVELYVVHVKEKEESVPAGEDPVEWTLYTTHRVGCPTDALQIVRYYTLRWIIEALFRTVKSEGVDYESSELESGMALRKLFVMALMAAIQILQLRQARSGQTAQRASLVFSQEQIACMEDLQPRLEGRTDKQKNPFDKNNLAWAAWTIARLGGWTGYTSQRPPGVIILHDGWIKFQNLFQGWAIAKDVYKR